MISSAWILIICEKTKGPNLAEIAKSNARTEVHDRVGVVGSFLVSPLTERAQHSQAAMMVGYQWSEATWGRQKLTHRPSLPERLP